MLSDHDLLTQITQVKPTSCYLHRAWGYLRESKRPHLSCSLSTCRAQALSAGWSRLSELGSHLVTRKRPAFLAANEKMRSGFSSHVSFKKKEALGTASGYSRCLDPVLLVCRVLSGRRNSGHFEAGWHRLVPGKAPATTGKCAGLPRGRPHGQVSSAPGFSHARLGPSGVRVQGVTGLCLPQGEMLDNIELNVMHTVDPVEKAPGRRPKEQSQVPGSGPRGEPPPPPSETGPSCALISSSPVSVSAFLLHPGKGNAMIDRVQVAWTSPWASWARTWQTPKRRSSIRVASG